MARFQAHAQSRLKSSLLHPGVLGIITIISITILWDTFVITKPTPLLSVLVLTQIALLVLSYRHPIPSIIVCYIITIICDMVFPSYSSYSLYMMLALLGLWAYRTTDTAAASAAILFTAYQTIWLSTKHELALTSVLFATIFAMVALLGCSLRHLFKHLHHQREQAEQLRTKVRQSAFELHDAVAARLTQVDLLLQYREMELHQNNTAIDEDAIIALDMSIRDSLGTTASDVARIVDMLIEQTDNSTEYRFPSSSSTSLWPKQ